MPPSSLLAYGKLGSCLGLLAILIAAAYSCASLGPPECFQPLRDIWEQERQGGELDAKLGMARQSAKGKRQIAEEVIEQRLTLREAAARMRDLDAWNPDAPYQLRNAFPGQTDEERLCRCIIHRVKSRLEAQGYSDQAAVVTARLEAELQECREREGAIRLPEVPR